jgi:hypothetical protein
MADFTKVVRLGTAKTGRGRFFSIYCKIKFKDGKLSISGVEGPTKGGNALGSCGQIDRHLRDSFEKDMAAIAPGWTTDKLQTFFGIWKRWHLNDMLAGCPHQQIEALLGNILHNVGDTCPVCGYQYGYVWNHEEVPEAVIEWLQALPDTDKVPAWV